VNGFGISHLVETGDRAGLLVEKHTADVVLIRVEYFFHKSAERESQIYELLVIERNAAARAIPLSQAQQI